MLLYAWILYFVIWTISFLLVKEPSKPVIALMAVLSIIDVGYLIMHDGRALLLVLLATAFAIAGVGKTIAVTMQANRKEEDDI